MAKTGVSAEHPYGAYYTDASQINTELDFPDRSGESSDFPDGRVYGAALEKQNQGLYISENSKFPSTAST